MTAVELADVTFGYGERPAVRDVSLTVEMGEFLGLVGPNGSGKTTLLKLMLGLCEPDAGTARLFGVLTDEFREGDRVGYVSQDATAVDRNVPLTVREAVSMGRYAHAGFRPLGADDWDAVDGAMETVGIAALAGRSLSALSGGQLQRVFIARALASEADLLALDEPAVGVDAESREAFYDLLNELNGRGITILLVEHDIGVVTEHAGRIACVNGNVFYDGDPAEFADSDALARAYGSNQQLVEHHHD